MINVIFDLVGVIFGILISLLLSIFALLALAAFIVLVIGIVGMLTGNHERIDKIMDFIDSL
jgi:hypothetical protein